MSIISLSASVPFKHKPESITLENVPTDGVKLPDDALTMFYGFSESREEISDIAQAAGRNKEFVANVTVKVDIGEMSSPALSPEELPNTRFLNLIRMTKAMEMDVIRVWKNILKEEGIKEESLPVDYFKQKNFLLVHPHLISKLRDYEMFGHVEAIAFPYDNPKYKHDTLRRRVALYSTDHVVDVISESYPEIKIELPELGRKRSHAPKMR